MQKGLFLDDERNPGDVTWISYPNDIEWVVARNYWDFKKKLSENEFDIVSFDHDIQHFETGYEYTGMNCVRSLIDSIIFGDSKVPSVIFHTQNCIGKENMECLWTTFLRFHD